MTSIQVNLNLHQCYRGGTNIAWSKIERTLCDPKGLLQGCNL